jgi:hypothetical protein
MPSASDIFDQLKLANQNLDSIAGKLDNLTASTDSVRAAVDQVQNTLAANLGQLITLTAYTNLALFHNDLQNDTVICILEKISKNTCDLVNQSHVQTALQTIIEKNTTRLAAMYAFAHADAALAAEREQALREEIEKCCPPKPPASPCYYVACPTPEPIGPPPEIIVIE